jgi:hypothetical protein
MADDKPEEPTKNIFDALKILRPPAAKKPKSQVEKDREAARKRARERRK